MAKLIILRGLPASGKSTWARSWCEDPANTWPHCVISLDDIRIMIAGSAQVVVPEFLRTLVFARPRGDDQFADCTFSPSLDMSR